ncbi:MAG: single-stranded DNA-binding protein, partial [Thiobacillus sp.]|nr:single-stranded DNA-binding protein [Thiobacillus sp.]
GGMADMDDGGYTQAPPPARSQPAASRGAPAQKPAGGGFDDMDDDIPF